MDTFNIDINPEQMGKALNDFRDCYLPDSNENAEAFITLLKAFLIEAKRINLVNSDK